jgi:hypothetical protein
LQKILKGLLDTKEETKLRQEDSRKNKPFWPNRPVDKE